MKFVAADSSVNRELDLEELNDDEFLQLLIDCLDASRLEEEEFKSRINPAADTSAIREASTDSSRTGIPRILDSESHGSVTDDGELDPEELNDDEFLQLLIDCLDASRLEEEEFESRINPAADREASTDSSRTGIPRILDSESHGSVTDDGELDPEELNEDVSVQLVMDNFDVSHLEEEEEEEEFERFSDAIEEDTHPRPAAGFVVEGLTEVVMMMRETSDVVVCAVCSEEMKQGEKGNMLPCWHYYHGECIKPWLRMRNTCPLCRFELPTDQDDIEENMRRRKRRRTTEEVDQHCGLLDSYELSLLLDYEDSRRKH